MSVVSLLNVAVRNNPAPFNSPYEFEITFEALEQLQHDLEWKLTYVGSATSSEHDQELDSLLVGPVPVGINKFEFTAEAPKLQRIPNSEILGVTVILLSCSYDNREFVRVGYYVNNEYTEEELNNEPPAKPIIEKVRRIILAEKPRVTRFAIKWFVAISTTAGFYLTKLPRDSDESAPAEFPPDQPEADTVDDDEATYGAEEEEEEEVVEEGEGAAAEGEDAEMGGVEEAATAAKDDAASDAGSEDLEAESSGSDEEDEEDEGEGDADEEMDMGDEKKGQTAANGHAQQQPQDVMVH
ncbi:histone deposition protein Asf1 [Aulographum hederae CBS 113979]|uniref:Histone chaperone n=1 Tax=Aulographum hederae CBS 113979 TaxID=1176131 RepID=A0A6G1H5I6_9PEZI|nr:histone deposition protein Asf1 [Aulographum hederae CBS 113979]